MKTIIALLTCFIVLASPYSQAQVQPDNPFPTVVFVTSEGNLTVELNREAAPITVANFLRYVAKAQYNNTIFHRLVPGFVIQGGGYDEALELRETGKTVPNESGNNLANLRGTIAMARTSDPHSANTQFFINLVNK